MADNLISLVFAVSGHQRQLMCIIQMEHDEILAGKYRALNCIHRNLHSAVPCDSTAFLFIRHSQACWQIYHG